MMQLENQRKAQMASQLKDVAMVLKLSGYYNEAQVVMQAVKELEIPK